jgi:hypothetical protein
LISVDGLHASDLASYVAENPHSALAGLAAHGVTYADASTSRPSDSFPGLLALLTGGSPKTTGVYYDVAYDRALFAPADVACAHAGTAVTWDESLDKDSTKIDGGGGLDESLMPRQKKADGSCAPVYPHEYVRVNNVFEVAHAAGLRTAWSDKHLSYDVVRGPSGKGVDDLYTPEIAAAKSDAASTIAYDADKARAIVAEIGGLDHTGTMHVGVPAIFGMNFQAVSVAQKASGYSAAHTPSEPLADALAATDKALGQIVTALDAHGLAESTLVIVTAKHGQSPIDRSTLVRVDPAALTAGISGGVATSLAHVTADDSALVWLADPGARGPAVARLGATATRAQLRVDQVLSGATLAAEFGDPDHDSRAPDFIVSPLPGTVYSTSQKKVAEHGGFAEDDVHVALLVAHRALAASTVSGHVATKQVAPTILAALHLDPHALEAVHSEGTAPLPALPF